VKMIHFT